MATPGAAAEASLAFWILALEVLAAEERMTAPMEAMEAVQALAAAGEIADQILAGKELALTLALGVWRRTIFPVRRRWGW